jgi:rRNA maturation RNase YbeY
LKIRIYYDNIKYRIRRTGELKKFLEKVIKGENYIPGDLIFILTGEESMLEINRKFLNHDYDTDVISFNWSEAGRINGEIYLGFETICRNASLYGAGIREELIRVMIHGTLHLCGYKDENRVDKEKMFATQEMLLKEYLGIKV